MAKIKTTTTVEVNASYEDLYNDFKSLKLVKHTETEWVYKGVTAKDKIVVEGHGFNTDGKFINSGEISSVHLQSGKVTLLDISYDHHPLKASLFATVTDIWGVVGVALHGNDKITGGAGNDYIIGGDGNDVINAGGGFNYVFGGGGNDLIDVRKGNDSILLLEGGGSDTVKHFDADGGAGAQDMIWANFSDCKVVADGKNTIIELKGTDAELHLIGVNHNHIDASDFLM